MKEKLARRSALRDDHHTMSVARVRMSTLGWAALTGACCFLITGCNDHVQMPVYPVHGQVLLNGKPLADAIVSFHAQDSGTLGAFPSAHTDEQGRYSLTTYEHEDGAPQGTYSVSIVCFRSRPLRAGQGSAVNVVPYRYTSPASSGLNAAVSPGDNDLPVFKLKGS